MLGNRATYVKHSNSKYIPLWLSLKYFPPLTLPFQWFFFFFSDFSKRRIQFGWLLPWKARLGIRPAPRVELVLGRQTCWGADGLVISTEYLKTITICKTSLVMRLPRGFHTMEASSQTHSGEEFKGKVRAERKGNGRTRSIRSRIMSLGRVLERANRSTASRDWSCRKTTKTEVCFLEPDTRPNHFGSNKTESEQKLAMQY